MTYQVNLTPSATRQLKKSPKAIQPLIWQILEALAEEPRPSGVVKMAGEASTYRVRLGDYRIVYEVQDEVLCILVIKVGHRREVYKDKR
jgi:mRNA interferase RelE/StbE